MPIVIVNPNCPPTSIDDFPAGTDRSREGSVHIRPMATLTLTEGELAHVRGKHPECYRHFTVPGEQAQAAHAKAAQRRAREIEAKKPVPKKPANVARLAERVRSRSLKLEALDPETRAAVEKVLAPAKPSAARAEPTPAPSEAPKPAATEAPSRRRSGRSGDSNE